MPAEVRPWRLANFEVVLDRWIELEDPPGELRNAVLNWILSLVEDPYREARREHRFENLWLRVIGHRTLGSGRRVVCTFWIQETTHIVRCDQIATLSYPI